MQPRVLVNLLCYNSLRTHGEVALVKSVQSILDQNYKNVDFLVADNLSTDGTWEVLERKFTEKNLKLIKHNHNFGYAAGQNFAVKTFLAADYQYLLCLTHDVALAENAVEEFVRIAKDNQKIILSPLLYRANEQLEALEPREIDAAGMLLNNSLRHLDISTEPRAELTEVFGATGAAIFFDRAAIETLLLRGEKYEHLSSSIYPQLAEQIQERAPLFDEAFFAYREDADLSWRANLLKVKVYCLKSAQGLHIRKVLPERRALLDPEINYWSVRNRFLMQINNYHFKHFPKAFMPGVIIRNFLVLLVVLIKERSSLQAFWDLKVLWRRAWERRSVLRAKI